MPATVAMDLDPWHDQRCKFCGESLEGVQPPHLTFAAHLDASPACRDAHALWIHNQRTDWGGG